MKYRKITFDTVDKTTKMRGTTSCYIYDQKVIYRFSTPEHGKITYNKMREQGLKVLFERGMIVQFFLGKTIEEISEIVRDDAQKGVENTKETKAEILLENWKEELVE